MMAPSHVAVGLATWVVAAPVLSLPMLQPLSLGLVVAGSLLPDIDHPASWVGRRTRPLSSCIAAILGHRGITHSLVAVAVLVVSLLESDYHQAQIWPLAIGYASHLMADMLTPRGLRLAWPMRRNWSIPLCRTGSPTEGIVVALILGLAWWSVSHGPPRRPDTMVVNAPARPALAPKRSAAPTIKRLTARTQPAPA